MARQLGRHRSTIYPEIKRNTFRHRELPDYDGYYSTVAHDISKDRGHRLRKLRRHPNLRTEIISQLEARWSPEQIAGRLLLEGRSLVACVGDVTLQVDFRKHRAALIPNCAVQVLASIER